MKGRLPVCCLRFSKKLDWLEKEDIIKRIVSLEFNRLIDYYQAADEIEEPSDSGSKEKKGSERRKKDFGDKSSKTPEKGYSRIFINIGKTDGVNPANLMGFINDYVPGKITVGRIDLMKSFSFFEVPEDSARKVVKSFKGVFVENRKIVVDFADNINSGKGKKGASDTEQNYKESKFRKNRKR